MSKLTFQITDAPSKAEKKPLPVFLEQNGDGSVSLSILTPTGDECQIFRLNRDGTGTLHDSVFAAGIQKNSKGQITLVDDAY